MLYTIKFDNGEYLTLRGHWNTHTNDINKARLFKSKAPATHFCNSYHVDENGNGHSSDFVVYDMHGLGTAHICPVVISEAQ